MKSSDQPEQYNEPQRLVVGPYGIQNREGNIYCSVKRYFNEIRQNAKMPNFKQN